MISSVGVLSNESLVKAGRNWFAWGKPVVFILCLLPALLLVSDIVQDRLGANPVEAMTRYTGGWGLRMLLLTLAMSPLRMITGNAGWIRWRRMLGLFVFFYATLHVAIYFLLDQSLNLGAILEDIGKRPYVTVGFLAFVVLVPLALTSNRYAIQWLGGKRWQKLHKLVYIAGIAVILHLIWQVKSDYFEAVVYSTIFISLMFFRIWRWFKSP